MLDIIAEAQGRLCADLDWRSQQVLLMLARTEQVGDSDDPSLAGISDGVIDTLFVIGQASLFGVGGKVTLDELASTFEKSKQYMRPKTKELIERGLIKETSARPLRFQLTQVGRELLGLDSEETPLSRP